MWQVLIARYSRILVMPVVVVIGAIGYFMEQRFSTPKKIPYLDASVKEGREKRQMEIELDSEYGTPMDINKIKNKIVPESSLLLNTGRKEAIKKFVQLIFGVMDWRIVGLVNFFTKSYLYHKGSMFGIVIQEKGFASYVRRRNHYDVLGIPYDATDEEIKDAFVKKSQELHPDGKNFNPESLRSVDKYSPDLTEQFMQLKIAYDILRRSLRRKQYDQMMGIERLKRFNGRSDKLNLYDVEAKRQSFITNFGMSAQEFVSRDFYVRLADSSNNSLMYFTVGGIWNLPTAINLMQ